ncbi:hypothetical protein RJT34_18565 [Clitoria ternatea]|uniref:Uncharacterized protein n=1 Tax=Clitoria ternatea TaxID=43366 RepID=A0AAN9PFJ6_CLITE
MLEKLTLEGFPEENINREWFTIASRTNELRMKGGKLRTLDGRDNAAYDHFNAKIHPDEQGKVSSEVWNLKQLKHLRIWKADEFSQLEMFEMQTIDVNSWTLENGAMPHLRHLVIKRCRCLKNLPGQLLCFTSLKLVHVVMPTPQLRANLQNMELKNGCKVIFEE